MHGIFRRSARGNLAVDVAHRILSSTMGAWRWHTPATTGKAPAERAGTAAMVHENSLYVLGGWDGKTAFDDGFAYNIDTHKWRKLHVRPQTGAATKYYPQGDVTLKGRIFFGAVGLNGVLYVHGGCEVTNLNDMHDDVLAFEPQSGVLRRLRTEGEGPGYLARNVIVARGNALWVVGGWTGKRWTNEVYRLDLPVFSGADAAAVWSPVRTTGFAPHARSHHCLYALPKPRERYLMMIGGGDGDMDFDDVYTLDVPNRYWHRVTNTSGDARIVQSSAGCSLMPLAPEKGRPTGGLAVAMHGGFGGPILDRDNHERMTDLRMLILDDGRSGGKESEAWKWTRLKVAGNSPPARMNHFMHVVNDSLVIYFGGSTRGKHFNDVVYGTPNKLKRAEAEDAADGDHAEDHGEGETDGEEDDAEEGSAESANDDDDDADGDDGGEHATAANGVGGSADVAAAAPEDDIDEDDMVVLATVKTSTKKAEQKKKAKKGKRRAKSKAAKEEL